MKDYTAVVKRKDSDELQHWKYKSKKKINGKWRYYYNTNKNEKPGMMARIKDRLGFDEKEEYERLSAERTRYKNAADEWSNVGQDIVKDSYRDGKYTDGEANAANMAFDNARYNREKAEEIGKTATKAWNNYIRTPIGKLDEAIENGKLWFELLFSKKK